MNFFRRKIRRDESLTTAPGTDHTWSDKSRRRSYFSVRRRDSTVQGAVPPAMMVKLSGGGDDDVAGKGGVLAVDDSTLAEPKSATKAGRTLRRRSIPGLAYLVSMRSTLQLGDKGGAAEVAMPEAAVHQGAAVQRAVSSSRRDRVGKRTSGSSDESSGGDSDDTLTARDIGELAAAHSGSAPATTAEATVADAGEQPPGSIPQTDGDSGAHTGGPGGAASAAGNDCASSALTSACTPNGGPCSTAFYIRGTVQESPQCVRQQGSQAAGVGANAGANTHDSKASPIPSQTTAENPRSAAQVPLLATAEESNGLRLLHAEVPRSAAAEPELNCTSNAALVTMEKVHREQALRTDVASTLLRSPQRRQQLTLGRWRGNASGNCGSRQHALTSAARSTLLSLTAGRHSPRKSISATEERPVRTLKGRHSLGGSRRVQSLLAGIGRSSDSESDDETHREQAAAVARAGRRRSSGTLGKLTMTPQPSAAEQARMDAWSADGDDFLVGDYDLSGANFELPRAPASLNAYLGADRCAYDGVPLTAKPPSPGPPAECATPASRLSSTSTVVEENALSPDQYKRIYSSSARKLQCPPGRRSISCIVHIRSIMAKANERHVVVTGGRALDTRLLPCDALADFYIHAAEPVVMRQPPHTAAPRSTTLHRPATSPVAYELSDTLLPVRSRSVGCMQQLAVRQPASPPSPPTDAEPLYNADLLGTDAGDLVSLEPVGGLHKLPGSEALDVLPVYRPMRRRRAGRRAAVRLRSAFVTATSVVAMP
ncbi:hypothetical protein H4R20_004114 [Coemansia guatemalensis]|uniref:Uncharacterized protein n=1 Tax=Coemansia guatemalensis TaxID=2761395 RepID=A0A9W8LTE8_9FUNG|nr:hypothetical protein H4R20_004114 [Coemansia guatemalensis]